MKLLSSFALAALACCAMPSRVLAAPHAAEIAPRRAAVGALPGEPLSQADRGDVATGGKKRTVSGEGRVLAAPATPPSATFSDDSGFSNEPVAPPDATPPELPHGSAEFELEPGAESRSEVPPAAAAPREPAPPATSPNQALAPSVATPPLAPFTPHAEHGAARDSGTKTNERTWYGHYTMLADLAALSILGAGAYVENEMTRRKTGNLDDVLYGIGGVGLILGAPAVHFSQRQGGRGMASLGIRIVAPLTGFLIGYNLLPDERDPDYGCSDGYGNCDQQIVLGMMLGLGGAVSAVVFDHSTLAWKPAKKKRSDVAWSVLPLVDRQRVGGAVTGTF